MLSAYRKSRKHNCWASFLGERILKLFINNKKRYIISVLDCMLSLDVTLLRALQPWQFLHVCWMKKALFNHIVQFCAHGCRELELYIE